MSSLGIFHSCQNSTLTLQSQLFCLGVGLIGAFLNELSETGSSSTELAERGWPAKVGWARPGGRSWMGQDQAGHSRVAALARTKWSKPEQDGVKLIGPEPGRPSHQ